MSDVSLYFDGPFSFTNERNSVFTCRWTESAGIYLWTSRQQQDKTHFIHYVGETNRLGKRHREHLINILGLNYGIFDPDDAAMGVCTILWGGLWRERNVAATKNAVSEYQRLHQQVVRYVTSITVFFAELVVARQLRRHFEGCIGWNLRSNHADCKQLYPDDNHIGTISDKVNGRLFVTAAEEIRGLDATIEY
jgi:hypothetical protein